ncbi:hypothetical protein KY285_018577 [Solanum tuberosum]|nr:hypothetical protein KY284_035929 [Solanum tuberosum]KAH0704299.1 hypothetical protein KY285_018577 [Solanum tuberosum]KAH0722934.1 hypothetical protein KY289_005978 [Solanum tuberosum]
MGTIMNVKGKTKDTINTRLDLQEMNIRPELHPIQKGEKIEVPNACYTLSPEDKHRACPEGCIAEGYIANECMALFSRYLHRIDTKFNRHERNYDGGLKQSNGGLSLFCQPEKTLGVKTPFELEADELEQAHIYILKNCDEVLPYLEEFAQIHENARHLSDVEWNRQFIEWFKDRVAQLHKGDSSRIMKDLLSLSRGPTRYSTHSNGYIVNGYIFHVEDYDKKLRTQNCGVVVLGENDKDSENVDYYGFLTDVIELQFVMDKRVTLFHCNWFDVYDEIKGVKKDEYDFVSVNPDRFLKTNEPFVLADQASQVFYANDNSNKGWQVVRKTQPHDSYEIVEQMDDDIVELGSPSQKKRKRTNGVKFKMKPLKTENEADSSMKGTIRYTFVAPGKGRGQGITNSTLFTSQGMPTIPKNSIDLEKENKQTNPSAHASINLGKGRGQGIINSTLFTSQGIPTIPKNSIDLEKENKQTNPSAHASTNLASIGKGRGQGPKSSTFFTSQGMGMKHNNNIASESEVGCINKSALYANQHTRTPSKRTRAYSAMLSSQEMQIMDKIILEQEDMQTIDQVMEHSQTIEKVLTKLCNVGSSNPTKVRRVRGSNMCKEVTSLENGEKLKVIFYNNRTVGTNSKLFSRHLGKIVRDRNMCLLGVSSWSDIKPEKLSHMWAAVEHKFEAVDMNDHRDHIFGWMNELWNKWRGHLHAKYVKDKPIQQSLKNIPRGVDKKEWEWLVKDHFTSESFQARSIRNATNRSKLKMLHHIGSKPIREIIYQKGGKDGNPPDLATIFFETRKKDNKLVEPEAFEKHGQLDEIVQEDPSLSSIEIVENCCGPQTRSHVFGFGGGVKAKDLKGGTSSKVELLSALRSTRDDNKFLNEENKSLNEENKSLNDRLSTLEDEMKAIMKMKEFFDAQQSNVPPTISPV